MSGATYDLVIRGGVIVNQDGAGAGDIGISDGRIAALGDIAASAAGEVIDAKGLHILPGVIDTQVHFREPGNEHKEDLETGSRAAVMGGVTAVFEMPNTSPLTISAETLADKIKRARGRMFCDFAFFMGGTAENAADLARLERLEGCPGVKVFMGSSTGSLLADDDDTLERIFATMTRRAAFHSEDEARLNSRLDKRREGDPASHPDWRDVEAALGSTRRLIGLARRHGKRVHVLHISTGEEMAFLSHNKDVATVEATPQHLTFGGPEDYARLGTLLQMNPPVRDDAHRARIWQGIADGTVDVLGSDHAPHTLEEKARLYPASPSGMPGVQTLVPVMLDHVNAGRLTLARFVDLTSHGPARIFQIAGKGRIAAGYDADLTIVDMKAKRTIANDWIESRCGWTPYDGMEVSAWVRGTLVRGVRAMWDDEIANAATGAPVRFQETLAPESA